MKLLIFLGESGGILSWEILRFWKSKNAFPAILGALFCKFSQYFGKYFILILAFGVSFAKYIRIYVGIYTAEINHHITTSKEFNEKTKQQLRTIYITCMHYNNVNI